MSIPPSTSLLLPSPVVAVLAMLGCQPDDDAWVLGQSGPTLTPAASAALTAWRLQQSVRHLLAVAPLWSASLHSEAATHAIIAAFTGHPWQGFLQQVWRAWRARVLASDSVPDVSAERRATQSLPSLAVALSCWQQEHERCWQALTATESAQLTATTAWPTHALSASAMHGVLQDAVQQTLPADWQQDLQTMAQRAGTLSAQAMLQPVAAEPSERQLHWQQHDARLYRYPASTGAIPIVLVYAWINRADVLDLSPQQSLIAALQAQGLAVWLLDWADCGAAGLSLDEYLALVLQPALECVCAAEAKTRVAVLGICQGGSLALTLAARGDNHIASLSLAVTPVDYHTASDRLSAWSQSIPAAALRGVTAHSPAAVNLAFLNLKPYSLRTGKYLALVQNANASTSLDNFLRLEHWLLSGPLLSGPGLADYLSNYYQRNVLCQLNAEGEPPLRRVKLPLQVLIAEQDHIVPPAAASALVHCVEQAVQVESLPSGHIGVLVGHQRKCLAEKVAAFVKALPS